MPRIELFAFRYRDPRTGKWIRARYVATPEEIAQRHSEWQIVGPGEVRDWTPQSRQYAPQPGPPRIGNLGPAIAVTSSSRRVAIVGVTR